MSPGMLFTPDSASSRIGSVSESDCPAHSAVVRMTGGKNGIEKGQVCLKAIRLHQLLECTLHPWD